MLNAISVDVEDHFHTEMMSRIVSRSSWPELTCCVDRNTKLLFKLFAEREVRATFFFLGWVAERYPALVREAAGLGHEVGCHSFWHRRVHTISPEEFREDTKRAKRCIEDATGLPVLGYRAPSFSMTPGTEWAIEILEELGFLYDSSVHPVPHDLYDNRDAPREPFRVGKGRMLEIPISTIRVMNNNYPFSGGGYFRLLPYPIVRWGIKRVNLKESKPVVFYIHPWELDDLRPQLTNDRKTMFRQYMKIGSTVGALTRMLQEFRFGSISEVFARELSVA
jgi:polysaccharide deacetylase family protein (PEP-CTERM system associated)